MAKYEDKNGKLTITLTEKESNEARSKHFDWRITDIIFFGSLLLMVVIGLIYPSFEYLWLCWVGLMLIVIFLKLLIPKSKFVRWMEKYR